MRTLFKSFIIIIGFFLLTSQVFAATNSVNSVNWAGYVSSSGTYTSVSGTWTVPTIATSTTFAADSTWIGIGGMTSNDLIQTGTQHSTSNNQATYQAWYELIPAPATPIPVTVHPGDTISASLDLVGQSQWKLHFQNNATGETYDTLLTYTSTLSSAEWIEEMPHVDSGYVPLTNFGQVNFWNAKTIMNGITKTLIDTTAYKVNMSSRGNVVTAPSDLGADGASFSVADGSTQVVPPAPISVQVAPYITIERFVSTNFPALRRAHRTMHRRSVYISFR